MFRVTVSGPREQEASFFTVVVGRLQQRSWTTEDSSARSTVEGRGRRAGAKPTVGNGDHDQDGAEPASVASSISAVGERDASEGAACQRSAPSLLILRVSREKLLYELKAGPPARQRHDSHRGAGLAVHAGWCQTAGRR